MTDFNSNTPNSTENDKKRQQNSNLSRFIAAVAILLVVCFVVFLLGAVGAGNFVDAWRDAPLSQPSLSEVSKPDRTAQQSHDLSGQAIDNNPSFGELQFRGIDFIYYKIPTPDTSLRLYWKDETGKPLRNFGNLKDLIAKNGKQLVFAMNAGMFNPANKPVGLYIEAGQWQTPIDTHNTGYGNFYLQPNGVLAFGPDAAMVIPRDDFMRSGTIRRIQYATQSGPMLVISRSVNAHFQPNSQNLFIRNGVGIDQANNLVFVISRQPVNFHTLASLFLEHFTCENALYLDGAISKLYLPELGYSDLSGNLGPFVTVVK